MICVHCEEPILETDKSTANPDGSCPMHMECSIRLIAGSVGHQRKECECYGKEDISEKGQSKRQAAQTAYVYFFYTRKTQSEKINAVQRRLKAEWN